MRLAGAFGIILVLAGGAIVLLAPDEGEPLEPASLGAPRESTTEPRGGSSIVALALGVALGLCGLALLARALRPPQA